LPYPGFKRARLEINFLSGKSSFFLGSRVMGWMGDTCYSAFFFFFFWRGNPSWKPSHHHLSVPCIHCSDKCMHAYSRLLAWVVWIERKVGKEAKIIWVCVRKKAESEKTAVWPPSFFVWILCENGAINAKFRKVLPYSFACTLAPLLHIMASTPSILLYPLTLEALNLLL